MGYNWNDHFKKIGIDMDKIEADERYSSDDRVLWLDILMRYIDGELDEENNADDIKKIEEEFVYEPHMTGVYIPDIAWIMAEIDELAYTIYKDYCL